MNLTLKKTIQDTGIMGTFPNAIYLYNFKDRITYKTVDLDHIIWENHDLAGSIIQNGESKVICKQKDDTVFLDDINGEILNVADFNAFELQLESPFEKDCIFGYKNVIYKGHIYQDIGCFYSDRKEFITLKEQYNGGQIIWISQESILYLVNNRSIEYHDYNFNKVWDLSFSEMETEQVLTCIDQDRFLFIIAEKGKLLKVDKASGFIVDVFQHSTWGNFRHNYFFRKDGQLILLSHDFYMEISPDNFEIKKQINFSHEDIFVKDCFFDEEKQCIYFYGTYGDSFPNLIGSFDINTASFVWKYIMKSEGKGNRFFNSPVPVGDFIVVRDGLKNVYVFEKEE